MAIFAPVNIKTKSGRTITYRNYEPEDVESFQEFLNLIGSETQNTMQYKGRPLPDTTKQRQRFEAIKNDPKELNLGAFEGSKVVGYINVRPWRPDGHPWGKHVFEFGIMVLKDYWGQGIGKKLLEFQDDHVKKVGGTRIEATTGVSNERALALYKSQGYVIEGVRKNGLLIDGKYVDNYFIAKVLDQKMHKPPVLQTERLILRPLEEFDALAIFEYAQNPNVSKYTLWEPHRTIQDSRDYIKNYAFEKYRQGVPEPLGITLKNSPDKVIGTVGCFWASQQSKSMELAYALSENYWGQGIVVEAAKALMDHCFSQFNLVRIQAHYKSANVSSGRVMQKLGMQHEGKMKSAKLHRGEYWDLDFYATLRI